MRQRKLGSPHQTFRCGLGWVAAQPLTVGDALAGEGENETPMTDDQGAGPVVATGEAGAEAGGSIDDGLFGFFLGGPPDFLDQAEILVRPVALQLRARRAYVAGEGVAFTHDRIDCEGQTERGGNRLGCLQRSGIGRNDDPLDAMPNQFLGGFMCLGVAQAGEAGINDARITPGGAEMQVELTLAMAQQDHSTAIQRQGSGGKQPMRTGSRIRLL
jgi:hypothetical protein